MHETDGGPKLIEQDANGAAVEIDPQNVLQQDEG